MGHLFIDDCKVKIPSLTCSELCFCPLCVSLPRVVSVDIFWECAVVAKTRSFQNLAVPFLFSSAGKL